jgi:molybdopterin synthase sulfur carrier subunit
MHITVKTFAQTREITGEDKVTLAISDGATVASLINALRERSEKWELALSGSVLTAVNQQLCDANTTVKDGDEVALFPPVTGG